ncbi:hypothetical protein CGRA01v4_13107 [Colletotrichum graminicola]|nr:hypothetical protein CGRA01v4_13107 [Colletotrichum graminicola]
METDSEGNSGRLRLGLSGGDGSGRRPPARLQSLISRCLLLWGESVEAHWKKKKGGGGGGLFGLGAQTSRTRS